MICPKFNFHVSYILYINFLSPSVCPSDIGRFDPLTVSAMSILHPPKNELQRPILLRICFFWGGGGGGPGGEGRGGGI
jgi:hypothetical protein